MKKSDYSVKGYSLNSVRNENEAKVCKMLEKIIDLDKYSELCNCGICLEDIYAISLSKLHPYYRHSLSIKVRGESSQDEEIETAITDAIEKVHNNKKHS